MRGFRLARIAAEAERLRLRLLLRRQIVRAVLGAGAVVFLLAALVALHVAAALALAEHLAPLNAALIVAAADVVVAIVLGLFATRNVPGRAEREALRVRRIAVDQAIETVALTAIIGRLTRVRSFRDFVNVGIALLVAMFAGARR